MKWRLIILIVALFALGLATPASASISPATLEATLAPGESVTENKTVDVPELPPRADVVFAFDLTGSMGSIINTAKARGIDIMNNLTALGVDINYGVMSYMDYPSNYSSYGYTAWYGWAPSGDYAYSLDQSITSNTTVVNATINALTLGYGYDGPQDYTRVFYESYADSSVGWRSGAKKILINFGDNVPHDNNLNEGVTTGNWSTGGDPGRDEVMFTADDLDLQTVLADMATNNVILLESHTTTSYKTYWDYWTGITGGSTFVTTSGTLVDDLVNATTAVLTSPTVTNLHLEASSGYESWLDSVTPASYSGATGVTVGFSPTIKVPDGTACGVYTFTISAVDDASVSYGSQDVEITVVCTVEVVIDIKPGSFPNSINRNNKGNVPVAIFSDATFDATTIDPDTVVFAGASPLPIGKSPKDVDGDGLLDIVLHFKTQELDLELGDIEACLTGETFDGQEFEGCDSVRIVK